MLFLFQRIKKWTAANDQKSVQEQHKFYTYKKTQQTWIPVQK